jgi:hypothetical protein
VVRCRQQVVRRAKIFPLWHAVAICVQDIATFVFFEEMNGVVDMAEQIKWWDALFTHWDRTNVQAGLQKARDGQHPDAQWLASLFPADVAVTAAQLAELSYRAEIEDA